MSSTPASSDAPSKTQQRKARNPSAPKKPFFKKPKPSVSATGPKPPKPVTPPTAAEIAAAESTKLARVRKVCGLDLSGHTAFEDVSAEKLARAVAAVRAEFGEDALDEKRAKKLIRKVVTKRVRHRKKVMRRVEREKVERGEEAEGGRCACGRLLGKGRGGRCEACKRKEGGK